MTSTFTRMARRLRNTLDNMATPCSVNAYGNVRRPPHELEVTICDLKFESSRVVNRNMKSRGNRPTLRFTACTNALVGTRYSPAMSRSRITFCPRTTTIN